MAVCSRCNHSKAAHHYDKDTGWDCQLCSCTTGVLHTAVAVVAAARRYAAERNCDRQVKDLTVKDTVLLRQVLRDAHECKGSTLTPFEKTNRQMDVEELADKLGVEL